MTIIKNYKIYKYLKKNYWKDSLSINFIVSKISYSIIAQGLHVIHSQGYITVYNLNYGAVSS